VSSVHLSQLCVCNQFSCTISLEQKFREVFRLSKAFAENLASQAAFTVFSALVRGGGNDTQAVEALSDALKVRPAPVLLRIVAKSMLIGIIDFLFAIV
jgi:hypothetical protein